MGGWDRGIVIWGGDGREYGIGNYMLMIVKGLFWGICCWSCGKGDGKEKGWEVVFKRG